MKVPAERVVHEEQQLRLAEWRNGVIQVEASGPSVSSHQSAQPSKQRGPLMEASDAVTTDVAASDDEVVVGDPGLGEGHAEQAPSGEEDGHGTHTPASAPPASAQSGVPLDEDKAAGVKPDPTDVTPPGKPSVAPTPGL